MPTIAVTAAPASWSATYRTASPVRKLVFARSPDASRTQTWKTSPEFEIAAGATGEEVRRRDGAAFTTVMVRMPPVYRHLPKDYAPFSPFGDGGLLFHTGRLFACPAACPNAPRWQMSVTAGAQDRIIVDGTVKAHAATWRDEAEGRNVYVGAGQLTRSGNLIGVIDTALPTPIRRQLDADLPRFMRIYAARLGALRHPPILFVSYDAAYHAGWGRQGGTLPGQVFVHFYGPGWPERMAEPGFPADLAWHFAHEGAHLYQRGLVETGEGNDWVHEGAAEAFAAIALPTLDPAYAPFVATKRQTATIACTVATRDRSMQAVIAKRDFSVAYQCGLTLNLALHEAVLAARPGSDGLFAVWRAFLAGANRRPARSYHDAVATVAGRCIADAMTAAATTPGAPAGGQLTGCTPQRAAAKPMARGRPV